MKWRDRIFAETGEPRHHVPVSGYEARKMYERYRQSRRMSAVESLFNVCVGFLVAVLANALVLPAFGFQTTLEDNVLIAIAFTVIGLIRSYVIRRFFNWLG